MGKQINFFLTDTDWEAVKAYLVKKGFVLLPGRLPAAAQPEALDMALLPDPKQPQKYLCLKSHLGEVAFYLSNKGESLFLDTEKSPVIEVIAGLSNDEGVLRGRFYYDEGYSDEAALPQQNAEFIKAARSFFAWFKRNHKIQAEKMGFYAGEAALTKNLVLM